MSSEATPVFQVNQKKLKELAESASAIKIGGKVRLSLFFIEHMKIIYIKYNRVQLVERRKLFIVQPM